MEAEKRRLANLLAQRFFVRFHLSLILALSFFIGLFTTKLLLALGLESLLWRWPLAVLAAYAGFFLGVRLWLAWIGLGRVLDRDEDTGDNFDLPDLNLNFSGGGSGSGSVPLPDIPLPASTPASGLGEFGGGGASADFSADAVVGDAGGGSLLPDVDLPDLDVGVDEGCLPILLLLLVLALLAAALGVGVYLVWQAPVLLAEAAFEAAVAAGLIRSAHRFRDPGWVGGALRSSWKPFLLVLTMTAVVAGTLQHFVPEARTLLDAVGILWAAV